jgi:hypothetical protein
MESVPEWVLPDTQPLLSALLEHSSPRCHVPLNRGGSLGQPREVRNFSMNSRHFDSRPKIFARRDPTPRPCLDLRDLGDPGRSSVNPPNCSVNHRFHTHTPAWEAATLCNRLTKLGNRSTDCNYNPVDPDAIRLSWHTPSRCEISDNLRGNIYRYRSRYQRTGTGASAGTKKWYDRPSLISPPSGSHGGQGQPTTFHSRVQYTVTDDERDADGRDVPCSDHTPDACKPLRCV